MTRERILIVEDEEDIREVVRYNLAREEFQVTGARSGEEALQAMRLVPADLVILDLMLPGMDGLEVFRRLRRHPLSSGVLVIMLTAKGSEADIVAGLELGADDYVSKPFSPRVLVARVRAALRHRREGTAPKVIEVGELLVDLCGREARVNGTSVSLTRSEFDLLATLVRRPGWVRTRGQLAAAVHGEEGEVTDRAVDFHIVGLRRKLGVTGRRIETVRGVGYRWRE